jgi:hypothetical protein
MANEIQKAEPPALPLAPEQYNRPFMDQNSNVLRLFFTRLTSSLNTLLGTDRRRQVSLHAARAVLQHY